jgi:hypothetical protein
LQGHAAEEERQTDRNIVAETEEVEEPLHEPKTGKGQLKSTLR